MPRTSTYGKGHNDIGTSVTAFALALAVGLVLARCMMLESLSDTQPVPGQAIVLRSPGPMASSLMDLLSFVPAVLVAGRALLDERFKLKWPASVGLLLLLAIWAMASITWSADRFAAGVSAGKLLGGTAIAWALVQCVRDWKQFRIVCAMACGLLAVVLAHSIVYRFLELPDMRQTFEANRAQILAERGIREGTFQAQQFAQKVMAGELMGFCASPNSLAALSATIGVIVMAWLWQRRRDGGAALCQVVGLGLLVGAGWVIWYTQSRTATLTPLAGLVAMAAGWRLRGWMAQRRAKVFAVGVAALLLGWAAVVAHGIYHGSLIQRSLTFRWHYWVGAMGVLKDHLLLGTGWENFSDYYLQYRVPVAPEEVRDPHNLFVRFAVELGIVGLVIAVGWLLRLAWEATAPMGKATAEPAQQWEATVSPGREIAPLMHIALIATVLVTIAATDFGQDPLHVLGEVMRRGLYGLLMLGTAIVFVIADLQRPKLERKSAEVLLVGTVCALGVLLLHNFIDFSLFETGIFYLFAMLGAAAVAMRMGEPEGEGRGGLAMLGVWLLVGAGFGVVVVVPAVQGDLASHRGDVLYADKRPGLAQQEYAAAFEGSEWLANEEYLIRQSKAQMEAGATPAEVLGTMDRAIQANPRSIPARLGRVSMLAALNQGDEVAAELQRVCALSPHDVGIHLDAATYLGRLGRDKLAREQYQAALDSNALLPADEPKRLTAEQVADIESKMAALLSAP